MTTSPYSDEEAAGTQSQANRSFLGRLDEGEDGGVVEAEIENGVHHAGLESRAPEGRRRAAAWPELIANLVPYFSRMKAMPSLACASRPWVGLLFVVIIGADLGGDGEAGGTEGGPMRTFGEGSRLCREEGFIEPMPSAFCCQTDKRTSMF